MSTISPGPATNSGTAANLAEQRATSPETAGKIVTQTAGSNATSAANTFEKRATEAGGIQH